MERHRLANHRDQTTLSDDNETSMDDEVDESSLNQSGQSDDESSTQSTDHSENSDTDSESDGSLEDESGSEDDEEDTIWDDIRDLSWTSSLLHAHKEKKAKLINEGMAANEAQQEAYRHVLSRLRRNIMSNYVQKVFEAAKLHKDPIHKKIMSTKRKLQEDEDYEPEEAIKYAVTKRKYIIQKATSTLSDDELEDDDEEYT